MESFDEMLINLYENLNNNKETLNIVLPNPNLIKNGTTFIWKNVKEYLKIVKRPPDHFLNFLRNELNIQINWITNSKSDGLILDHKKIKTDAVINAMKIYLKEYVICKSCISSNTFIQKDKNLRKYNFTCLNCNNEYYID